MTTASALDTDRPRAAALTLQAKLRTAILDGTLPGGTILSQVALAHEYGVSRGPLREALRMLQREGLIEAEVNRRARVVTFSVDDLEQLYGLRIVTEALAIRVSVPMHTGADLAHLETLLHAIERPATDDMDTWDRAHRAFHEALSRHAGERTTAMIGQLLDHSSRYRRMHLTLDSHAMAIGVAEHRELLRLCVERDAAGASRLLGGHLARTALSVMLMAAPEHEPAMVRSALRIVSGVDLPGPASTASTRTRRDVDA